MIKYMNQGSKMELSKNNNNPKHHILKDLLQEQIKRRLILAIMINYNFRLKIHINKVKLLEQVE